MQYDCIYAASSIACVFGVFFGFKPSPNPSRNQTCFSVTQKISIFSWPSRLSLLIGEIQTLRRTVATLLWPSLVSFAFLQPLLISSRPLCPFWAPWSTNSALWSLFVHYRTFSLTLSFFDNSSGCSKLFRPFKRSRPMARSSTHLRACFAS